MDSVKAVILAGGEGRRLRPLTCRCPKPLVPVLNRPLLNYLLEHLVRHHVRDIILTMSYLPERIQEYCGDGSSFGARLTYVIENLPLGTAGAVKNVEEFLGGSFFVFNGDVFADPDLEEMLAFHRKQGAMATIALTPVDNPTLYGVVETDARGRVLRFLEKPSWEAVTTPVINAGIYILEPEVLSFIPPNTYYMFEQGVFPTLLKQGLPVYSYPCHGYWLDVGTPEKYLQLHHDLLRGKLTVSFPGQPRRDQVWIDGEADIHPSAQLRGPIILGKGCSIGPRVRLEGPTVLGDGCEVGEGSSIEEAVLWRDVHVGAGVTLRRCLIGEGSVIEDGSWVLDGAIVGDRVLVGRGNKLEHGIRLWPGKVIEPESISF